MKLNTTLLFSLLNVFFALNSFPSGKTDKYYYQNAVFSDKIKSVAIYREGNVLSNPVIELGSDVKLLFKFDDLAEDVKDYYSNPLRC